MALQANNYFYINASGTYSFPPNPSAPSSFCELETIKVNKAGSSGSTITVTENKTGNTIAVIDSSAIHKHDFDLSSLGGFSLAVVTGGGGAAADITVIYQ